MSNNNAFKIITVNRKAFHDYEVLERLEAGLVLKGTEIKSIRAGRANIRDAYARPQGNELWLVNAHIAHYAQGGINNHEPNRPRKLLLHRKRFRRAVPTQPEQPTGAVGQGVGYHRENAKNFCSPTMHRSGQQRPVVRHGR